ncbi:MAG: addiction module protein [Chitinivibrionales bacterium]|nr:addiction module protein [Chitinivibrionales bacterium]
MKNITAADLLRLSVAERLQFVEDVWDSIASVPEELPITEDEKQELDRRLEAFHKDPQKGSPWSDVKTRILSRTCEYRLQ